MAHRILIADPDEAFGLMLKQMLEMNGDYTAEYVPSGERALAAAQQSAPDLVILDLSVADIKPPALVQSLRDVAPMLRVMLIPVGDALPDDVKDIEIHGMLTKPFFIGDLGQHISHALGIQTKELVTLPPPIEKKATQPVKPRVRQIVETPTRLLESPETKPLSSPPAPPRRSREEQPAVTANNPTAPATSAPPPRVRQIIQPSTRTSERAPQPLAPPPTTTVTPNAKAAIDKILSALANETRADALFVLHKGSLVTQHSAFTNSRAELFVEMLLRWAKVASEMAAFIGEAYGRFQQLHLEGERYHVYTLDLGNGLSIIVISRTDVTLGTVRLHTKAALSEIAKYLR